MPAPRPQGVGTGDRRSPAPGRGADLGPGQPQQPPRTETGSHPGWSCHLRTAAGRQLKTTRGHTTSREGRSPRGSPGHWGDCPPR